MINDETTKPSSEILSVFWDINKRSIRIVDTPKLNFEEYAFVCVDN